MLGSGEEIVFEEFENYLLTGHNAELSRFTLYVMSDLEEPNAAKLPSVLINEQGEILALAEIFHPQLEFLVAGIYNEYGELRFGLIDWDGNTLLPFEFEHLDALPGNALFAVAAGRIGIIDFGGNWIYF